MLTLATLPAGAAYIVHESGAANAPIIDNFDWPFSVVSDTPITLSGGASASALFFGQGASFTPNPPSIPQHTYETVTGTPATGPLELESQPSNAGGFQNVAVASAPALGLNGAISGWLNNQTTGVISFLFQSNISTFGLDIRDAGSIDPSDAGEVTFAFFGRDGTALDTFTFTASNGPQRFISSEIDIAGVQITNQDFNGLTYDDLRAVPIPSPLALVAAGLFCLRLTRRR